MCKPRCSGVALAWKSQYSVPTLPKAPWQMSVRVAPPAMNWGLEHSSWEHNKPCITHGRRQGREQARCKLTKPSTTADERHRDGAGQERVRAPDTPSTVRTGAGDQSSCAAISVHRTCQEVHCISTHVKNTHRSAITSPPLTTPRSFRSAWRHPGVHLTPWLLRE